MLRALAERRIGRRDQATAWIRRLAEYTREIHEEYATQRWPETKRLLGLLVNSAGSAHGRNARRLAHAARKQDRRLAAALLAAALALTHTPEAEEALRGAWTRMARKPTSLARDLLRNFPKRRPRGSRRKRRGRRRRWWWARQALCEGRRALRGGDEDARRAPGLLQRRVCAGAARGRPQTAATRASPWAPSTTSRPTRVSDRAGRGRGDAPRPRSASPARRRLA